MTQVLKNSKFKFLIAFTHFIVFLRTNSPQNSFKLSV